MNINFYNVKQGWFVPEAAHPYRVLSPEYTIDFASPAGANPPVDEGSVKVSVASLLILFVVY